MKEVARLQQEEADDKAARRPNGRPSGETLYAIQSFPPTGTSRQRALRRLRDQRADVHVDNIHTRPTGTSVDSALRRLRSQRTDLHTRVLAGELSPHAAAVEAGFRRKTITLPLDPEAAARTLLRHFTPDELEWLRM